MQKHCNSCSVSLTVGVNWTEAQRSKNNYKCNDCRAAYQREYHQQNKTERNAAQKQWYKENKETHNLSSKKSAIQRKYGISVEEYNKILSNPCQICGKTEDMVLDHCHNSGDVRGALCRQCNSALGLFKDDLQTVKSAVNYLENFKGV